MKKDLIEIRFHGRGGQGAKTAADLLGHAALEEGKCIQSFPEYGPERAGAPIRAFVRISDCCIKVHSGVLEPDIVIVIDPTLLSSVNVKEGLKKDGFLLVNAKGTKEEVKKITGYEGNIYICDATGIALQYIGSSVPNMPMLGALLKINEVVKKESLINEFKLKMGKKLKPEKLEANLKAIEEAYVKVK